MQLGLVGLGRMGGNMRERLRAAGHEVDRLRPQPGPHRRRDPGRTGREAGRAPGGLGDGAGRSAPSRPSTSWPPLLVRRRHHHRRRQLALQRRPPAGRAAGDDAASATSTSASPAASGAGERLRADGRRRRGARRATACRSSRRSSPPGEFGFVHAGPVGAGHYAKMVHNGIEYGLMHAYAEGYELLDRLRAGRRTCPASSSPGGRARSSGPGCSTCWTGRSTRTRTWPGCAATPTTPARAAGRSRRRSGSPCR